MDKILFYKDINENSAPFTEDQLGRKGLSLALLTKFKLPVPPFFILTTGLFKHYLSELSKNVQIGTLEELKKEIISSPLPPEYNELLSENYRQLSGFGKSWVAIRGSISAPKHPSITFSGQLDTFLNIRDVSEIELAIKEIYASLFSENVYEYLKKNNISYSDISVAIIVQKMIQAEVSGVMYTFDPITLNKNNVSVEAVFGLGDVLNDGTINPDIYVVSKNNYEILEKRIVPQEWMKVRRIGDISSLEHVQKIKISKVWQYSQKLDENLIRELASIGGRVESIIDPFQIVEWTMEGGSLWVLQIKAVSPKLVTSTVQSAQESVQPENNQRISTMTVPEAHARITEAIENEKPKAKRKKNPEEIQETLLFLGNPASPGTAYGRALILSNEVLKQDQLLQQLLDESNKETILITEEFSSKLEQFFYRVGAVITNYGGINSDAAITARELGLPAIVGTRIATVFIQNGTLLKIDGTSGTVYRVDELPDVEKISAPKISKAQQEAAKTTTEQYDLTPRQKNPISGPVDSFRLFIPSYIGNSHYLYLDDNSKVDHDTDYAGIAMSVRDFGSVAAKRLKRLKNSISGSLYVIIEDLASLDSVMEKKRKLSAQNIRRSKKVKIIVEVSTFFSLLNLERFVGLNIDGFVFNLEKLNATYGLGHQKYDENLLNLLHTNIQKVKNQQLDLLACSVSSDLIQVPLGKEITAIANAGCNSIFVTKGDKTISSDLMREFSSAFQSTLLVKK